MKTIQRLLSATILVSSLSGTISRADEMLTNSSGQNPQAIVRAPSSVQVQTCESMAQDFKTSESQDYFLNQCFDHYLGSAKPGAVKYSDDGKVFAFGFESMLFSKIDDQKFVITGSASHLSNIRNVALDVKNHEVWVVDGDHLYAFALNASGNRAPLRGLEGRWVRGISALTVDAENNEIYVLNSKIQRILVYDRKADMLYRSSAKKLNPKREIYAKNREIIDAASIFVCSKQSEFGVLSPAQQKLYFFSMNAKGWSKPTGSALVSANAVTASCSSTRVQVLDAQGSIADIAVQ